MTEPSKNSPLNGLVELSNRTGADIRPTLLRVMTDLYLQKPEHTESEEAEYTRMALKLIDHVDAKTRAMIAGKIAGYPNAPAAMRQRLLKDHIVLKAAEQPGQEAAKETAEQSTGTSAGNVIKEATSVPGKAPAKPSAEATASPAPAPLSGSKATALELSELFAACDAEERRLILLNLPYAPIAPADALDAASAQAAIQRLEAAALAHQAERFTREFGRALSISMTRALPLTQDPGGEPIVVAASALQMPAAVLARILLCLNPAISRSVQRVYDLTLLHEELKPASALRLVAIWQAADREEKRPAASTPIPVPRIPQRAADDSRPMVPAARPKIRWEELARKADGG
jgi:hypothetical protein